MSNRNLFLEGADCSSQILLKYVSSSPPEAKEKLAKSTPGRTSLPAAGSNALALELLFAEQPCCWAALGRVLVDHRESYRSIHVMTLLVRLDHPVKAASP